MTEYKMVGEVPGVFYKKEDVVKLLSELWEHSEYCSVCGKHGTDTRSCNETKEGCILKFLNVWGNK